MKVEKVFNNEIITPKTTGYAAAIGLGASLITGKSRNRTLKGAHKPVAIITALTTILHIAQIEYLNHKYKTKI